MSKLIVVYSTLATDMRYTNHKAGGAEIPQVEAEVFIKGGAGIANDRLITAMGVATILENEPGFSAEDKLEALKKNPVFQLHERNGYLIVSSESVDPEKMAANMSSTDPSRPLGETDLQTADKGDETGVKVATNAKKR